MKNIFELLHAITERLDRIEESISKKNLSNLMTTTDIEDYTSLSKSTIRRHIKRGTLKSFKDEGKKLFRRSDVDKWLGGK